MIASPIKKSFLFKITLVLSIVIMFFLSSGTHTLLIDGAQEQGINLLSENKSSFFITYIWLALSSIAIASFIIKKIKIKEIKVNNKLMLLFAILLLSISWSYNHQSAARVAIFTIISLSILYINSKAFPPKLQVAVIHKILMAFLLLSVVVAISFPKYGVSIGAHEGSWQGVFTHKNALGNFSAMAFCIFLAAFKRNPGLYFITGTVLSIFLALMSQSKTSIFAIAIVSIIFALSARKSIRIAIYNKQVLVGVVFFILCISIPLINSMGHGTTTISEETSFTGRNVIWNYTLAKIYESPLVGYGLAQFVNFDGAPRPIIHNGFLEVIFSLGLIGAMISCCFLFPILKSSSPQQNELDYLYIFIVFVIINTFESRLIAFDSVFFLFIYCFYIKESSISK